jgi:hypothetical protein
MENKVSYSDLRTTGYLMEGTANFGELNTQIERTVRANIYALNKLSSKTDPIDLSSTPAF